MLMNLKLSSDNFVYMIETMSDKAYAYDVITGNLLYESNEDIL
jgi:hypothetical protein